MQSWLNWYSIGLENRHSEMISGFESLALRYAYVVKRLRQRTATPRPLVRIQPYAFVQCIFIDLKKGKNTMLEIKGKVNTAICYATVI